MRMVIARCSVDYAGRLATHLPSAVRLLLVKADGSVLVHADYGGYKPLNWMSAPCTLAQEAGTWRVTNRAGETMTIEIEEVLHDSAHPLGLDPGLVKDGVEKHLQALLAERCHAIRPGLSLVRREYPTDIGPVDLLCRDQGRRRRRRNEAARRHRRHRLRAGRLRRAQGHRVRRPEALLIREAEPG
jgi:RecB family endonuclease NucS